MFASTCLVANPFSYQSFCRKWPLNLKIEGERAKEPTLSGFCAAKIQNKRDKENQFTGKITISFINKQSKSK